MAKYNFTVQFMSPHPQAVPRYEPGGSWLPPKAFGNNVRRGQPIVFRHNGESTRVIDRLPRGVTAYKTYSLYYCSGILFAAPCDATAVQVHDGNEAATSNGEVDYEDEDGDDDDDDDGDEPEYQQDWGELKFGRLPNDTSYLSYAKPGLEFLKLLVQRNDQQWAHYLLPDRYQRVPRTDTPTYGGLVGELPLLLALVALSMPVASLTQRLPQIITNPWQLPPAIENHVPRSSEWQQRKGLVVTVYHNEEETPSQELRRYELGVYGPILP